MQTRRRWRPPTVSLRVLGSDRLLIAVTDLIKALAWFDVTPLPNNYWDVSVKNEESLIEIVARQQDPQEKVEKGTLDDGTLDDNKIAKSLIAKAPPGWGEAAMRRLKKQYPGEPEKAFATAWMLKGKGVSGADYMKDKKGSRAESMLDDIVAKVCEPIIAKKTVKQRARGTSVFQSTHPKVKDNKDHFPINDLAHGRNALARVMQYDSVPSWYSGTLGGLQNAVKREVYKKFPGLKSRKEKREDK